MTANTAPGTTWKEIMYDNPDSPNKGLGKIEGYFAGALGQKMWQRSDGAILWLHSKLIVRSFLPRTNTKRNSKRKRNRKPANQFRSSDEVLEDLIADNLSETGWSWGCVTTIDSNG